MLLTKEEEAVKTALWLAEHGDYLKEVGESSPLSRQFSNTACMLEEGRLHNSMTRP